MGSLVCGGANSEEDHLFDVQTTVVGQENRDRPVKPRQASTVRSVRQRDMLTSGEPGLASTASNTSSECLNGSGWSAIGPKNGWLNTKVMHSSKAIMLPMTLVRAI